MGLYEDGEGGFDDEGEEAEEGAEPQVGYHAMVSSWFMLLALHRDAGLAHHAGCLSCRKVQPAYLRRPTRPASAVLDRAVAGSAVFHAACSAAYFDAIVLRAPDVCAL